MNYHNPKPLKKFSEDFDIDTYTQQINQLQRDNEAKYDETLDRWNAVLVEIKALFGIRGRVYKYMRKERPAKPKNLKTVINKTTRNYNAKIEKEENRVKAQKYFQRRKEAISILEGLGLEAGKDFVATRAISHLQEHTITVGDEYVLVDPEPVFI